MTSYRFETLDVFTDRRFGGNPLAVFTDATGMDGATMQRIAAELNLSETSFVLPPEQPGSDARVRIFHRTAEMPFAGHPSIGTAWALARLRGVMGESIRLEVPAGLVDATLVREADGRVTGARIAAPQALTTGQTLAPATIAACVGIDAADIVTAVHPPIEASVGVTFVLAQVTHDALARCVPDLRGFRAGLQPDMAGRLSLLVYARDGESIAARMFAPIAGTIEDPATGSANAALAALLLSLDGGDSARFDVVQGVEMGRPSLLSLTAARGMDGIRATVAGACVPMFTGAWEDRAA